MDPPADLGKVEVNRADFNCTRRLDASDKNCPNLSTGFSRGCRLALGRGCRLALKSRSTDFKTASARSRSRSQEQELERAQDQVERNSMNQGASLSPIFSQNFGGERASLSPICLQNIGVERASLSQISPQHLDVGITLPLRNNSKYAVHEKSSPSRIFGTTDVDSRWSRMSDGTRRRLKKMKRQECYAREMHLLAETNADHEDTRWNFIDERTSLAKISSENCAVASASLSQHCGQKQMHALEKEFVSRRASIIEQSWKAWILVVKEATIEEDLDMDMIGIPAGGATRSTVDTVAAAQVSEDVVFEELCACFAELQIPWCEIRTRPSRLKVQVCCSQIVKEQRVVQRKKPEVVGNEGKSK